MTKQVSRRGFMKNSAMGLALVAMVGFLHTGNAALAEEKGKKRQK